MTRRQLTSSSPATFFSLRPCQFRFSRRPFVAVQDHRRKKITTATTHRPRTTHRHQLICSTFTVATSVRSRFNSVTDRKITGLTLTKAPRFPNDPIATHGTPSTSKTHLDTRRNCPCNPACSMRCPRTDILLRCSPLSFSLTGRRGPLESKQR